MSETTKHTPGPITIDGDGRNYYLRGTSGDPQAVTSLRVTTAVIPLRRAAEFDDEGVRPLDREGQLADAVLYAAAPAYAKAWALVPSEVKGRILDALHSPDSAWVADAIARAEGATRP